MIHAELFADRGSGPPLAYVPGVDGTGELLLDTGTSLEQSFRVLRFRYRLGDRDGCASYQSLAEEILEALEAKTKEPILLLAESFGGAVALQTALLAPHRIHALAIVNSFAHYPKRMGLAASRFVSPLVGRRLFGFVRQWISPLVLFHPRREKRALRSFRALTASTFDAGYRERLRMIAGLDLRNRLQEIVPETEFFAADRDLVVPSEKEARRMASQLPNARVRVLERSGHVVLPLEAHPWQSWLVELHERASRARAQATVSEGP